MLSLTNLFGLLVVTLSSIAPSNGQIAAGYQTSPFYVATFDSAPTSTQQSQSGGGFQWITRTSGRQGAAYLDRKKLNYIDVKTFPDNYGRTVGSFGGETSVEMMVYATDFKSWMRLFDFAIAPVDSAGVTSANPTDHRYGFEHGTSGNPTYRYQIGQTGTTVTSMAPDSIYSTHGEWVHLVCVTSQNAGITDLTANTAGFSSIYINGRQVINGTTFLPRNIVRNINWIGKSSYWRNGDNYENMFLDTFAMYSYPLSGEAIYAHLKTSRPPMHELVFDRNPALLTGATAPTFSWSASDSAFNKGVLQFSGASQYIDLLASTGASSAGTSMITTWNGASSGSPLTPGASYTAIVKFGALTANSPVFDMKDSGSNRVRMYVNAAGNIVFSLNSLTVTSTSTVSVGTWYHLAACVSSTGNATLYINSDAVGTATGTALSSATYNTAFLARSTDATPVYFNGMIDAVRFFDIALSAAEVSGLHSTTVRAPNGLLEEPRASPAPRASPVVAYTFSKPVPTFGEAGISNYTVLDSAFGRAGMAYFDGATSLIQLKDHADDYGRMMPTIFGGSMSFECTFQFRDSSNQATVWSFTGGRSQDDNNLHLQNTYWQDPGNVQSLKIEAYGDQSANKRSIVYCHGCTNGSWVHAVMTIEQVNFVDPTASNAAETTLYLNGILIGSAIGWLPPVAVRPGLWLGKPAWDTDAMFAGQIDSFYWYNVEMSAEAVAAHYALPAPPTYELVFAVDPRRRAGNQANAGFGWSFNDTADPTSTHKGVLVLTSGQYVDMSATSGANFIGFTIPLTTGTGRNTPGVEASQSMGWSVETAFYPQSVAQGVTIFELGNNDGSNSIKLSFTAAGQLSFTTGVSTVSCGQVIVNTWVNIAVGVSRDGSNYEASCYQNGERVGPAVTIPEIQYVTRQVNLLGKAITGSNTNFIGQIDSFRLMSYAITSEDAAQLFEAYSKIGRLNDPPAFQSGPIAAWSFDQAPLASTDPSTTITYNYYNWQLEASGDYPRSANHTGLALFDDVGTSYTLRNYLDLNFDADSYGMVMPQLWGSGPRIGDGISFEFWISMASPLRPWQRVFDCGDDDVADIGNGDAIGKWNIWVGCNQAGALTVLHYYATGAWTQLDIPGAWRPGTWQHVVVELERTTATTGALIKVYVNGVLAAAPLATQPPPVRMRRNCYLGRSNWNDAALNATVDSFYFYNYVLSENQIQQHMVLPSPAQFDASFDTDPSRVTNPAYSWANLMGGDNVRRGQIIFNGVNQFVNLNAGSGNTSIGQAFPLINGASIGINQQGFSIELSAKWSDLSRNTKVFDIGNGRGVDSVAIGNRGNVISLYVHNGLTDTQDVIDMFTATVETFYHMTIVGTPVFNSTTLMNYQIYHSGNLVATTNNRLAPLLITRRRAFLGQSNNPADSRYFSGSIDLLRYYSYALRPNYVSYLYQLQGTSGLYVPPTAASSTGVPAVSSSSSARTVSSSSSTPVAPTLPPVASSSAAATIAPVVSSSTATQPQASSSAGTSSAATQPQISSSGAAAAADSSSSSSLAAGAIAGIVIGAVAGVALLCCVVFFLCFSNRHGKSVKLEDDVRERGGSHHEDHDNTYEGESGTEVEMA